ncbi:MAG: tetratricopeptide repeat protein [Dehalococcoidales bacterium]
MDREQWDLAIADANKAIGLDPNVAITYFNRGRAYKEQGKKAEAIADFEKFITLTNNPRWIEMARKEIEELSQ